MENIVTDLPPQEKPREVIAIRRLLVQLFKSQMQASRQLHFHARTIRCWCHHGAPPHVLPILRRLQRKQISLPWARKLLRLERSRQRRTIAARISRW
jgi:hypothetical protein